ncbi:unnamed protein product [Rodentolepis nana]|uniref:Uncharacterized protein n=1 Tax=Rodentolepis nana TaxID=102285 RepID=A0A0R3T9P5_RODNA|nr:unnamed protein product [Rodentolepis nana]
MIVTMPQAKLTKAIHVKETWARRLNGFTFISSEDDKNLPSILIIRDISLLYAYAPLAPSSKQLHSQIAYILPAATIIPIPPRIFHS